MQKTIKRYNPDINQGLTDKQINSRIKENLINFDTSIPTKSISKILYDNFFTLFNFINLVLALAVFVAHSYKNMLFLAIVIINTSISTIQEIHSKKIIDKLSVLSSNKTTVIRNSKKEKISINDIVLDDIVEFKTGNQVPTDCIILDGEIQVNESFITGEPDNFYKKVNDILLSGSYIVSGKCIARVEHIGEDNYTSKISTGAKYVKKINSEIMNSFKKIIRFLTFAIVPIGISLFYSQHFIQNVDSQTAIIKTVAAIIGMIPEGLILLTSTVLAVSVIRLSKSKVLVQELYCIETLARVDTLCLDKTGTLTEGIMEIKDFIPINTSQKEMKNVLANIAKFSDDENSTIQAIQNHFNIIEKEFIPKQKIAFSSHSKWSGINFENEGSYIIGAPEVVLKKCFDNYKNELEKYSQDYRVIALGHSNDNFIDKQLPDNISLIGYIFILDKIRNDVPQTLRYFKKQGVDIKIISGDNPITVSRIAKQVGIKNYEQYIDLSQIDNNGNITDNSKENVNINTSNIFDNIVKNYTIFGRVSPTQKKELILALKRQGKTVAMTGDGVNDVLALKESDCSIAMANGSDTAKNVSQLILLDSNFESMPKIVAEGRRTINNIQRSASLFLVKTIYSILLALMFLFMGEAYPFVPIQLSLISSITIGIPSFLLALEPNTEKIKGNFLYNIISKSLPTGLTVALNIFIILIFNQKGIIPDSQFSSLCVISTGICGLILLFTLTKSRRNEDTVLPISVFRLSLALILTFLFIFAISNVGWWFYISPILPMLDKIIRIFILSIINFVILTLIFKYAHEKEQKKYD